MGVGGLALAELGAGPCAVCRTVLHFAPKAKSVIYSSGWRSSHLDPSMQTGPAGAAESRRFKEMFEGKQLALIRPTHLAGYRTMVNTNSNHAGSIEISGLLPNLQTCADRCALSPTDNQPRSGPLFMQTGFGRFGRPSPGVWTNYGLGSLNQDLPGFAAAVTGQRGWNSVFGSGFLPSVTSVSISGKGSGSLSPIPRELIPLPASGLSMANQLNREQLHGVGDPEIATHQPV